VVLVLTCRRISSRNRFLVPWSEYIVTAPERHSHFTFIARVQRPNLDDIYRDMLGSESAEVTRQPRLCSFIITVQSPAVAPHPW
jgi:hypothetical protein